MKYATDGPPKTTAYICPVHGAHGFWDLSNLYNDGLETVCGIRDRDGQLCSKEMTRPPDPPKRVAMQVRVDRKLHDWLHDQADKRDVSVAFLVNRAIEVLAEKIAPIDEMLT